MILQRKIKKTVGDHFDMWDVWVWEDAKIGDITEGTNGS